MNVPVSRVQTVRAQRAVEFQTKVHTTVFALAVMEYAVGVSKFGKNPITLLVHQY